VRVQLSSLSVDNHEQLLRVIRLIKITQLITHSLYDITPHLFYSILPPPLFVEILKL